jgi:molybdopterin-dependent oxidoreductase alpha subunit
VGRDDDKAAGGIEALRSTVRHTLRDPGLVRGVRSYLRLNQASGFDCPGCAWPEPGHRGALEFCEQGAKAVAHEATRRTIGADFFHEHSIPALLERPDGWLERQGRIVEPLVRRRGSERYEPIAWDEAFALAGETLRGLDSPDEAIFYTSGRTSNEAAFLYQLFVREFGTNNLPDCSNLCHESSGTGLTEVIGVGKGTVDLADFTEADAVFVIGQNPGSNHPRMLATLQAARRRGCRIVSVNPLRERGLVRFAHPKDPLSLLGRSEPITDLFLRVRVGGDVALLKAIMKVVLRAEAEAPGEVLDWDFIHTHTTGFDAFRAALDATPMDALVAACGVPRDEIEAAARVYLEAERVIVCWAMGLTQHKHGVANVQEIVNLLLLRGHLGRPGAGPCPVRGHSNVQGDRTMGIFERPAAAFLDRLEAEFGFAPPRRHGLDVVGAIEAMRDGRARFFMGLGGNFVAAAPDTPVVETALRAIDLTVHVATKLNRSHLVAGETSLLLPCLGRTERDVRGGREQFVTVEDSMAVVHRSQGGLEPAGPELRSEPAIVAGLARATLGDASKVAWEELAEDYDRVRDHVERVIPGFEAYNERVRRPSGFTLPRAPRQRRFDTPSGRAVFTVHPVPPDPLGPGQLLMMTIRSHDQYNTTVYGDDDRYRGIAGGRRVVLVNEGDLDGTGLREGDEVTLTSHFEGETRSLPGFRIVSHDLPPRCVATYFPEANPLVPLRHRADGSRTPAYKSVVVTLHKGGAPG